jgi:hypothetical protein
MQRCKNNLPFACGLLAIAVPLPNFFKRLFVIALLKRQQALCAGAKSLQKNAAQMAKLVDALL